MTQRIFGSSSVWQSAGKVIGISLLVILVLSGCGRGRQPAAFVARVNNEYLTQDEMRETLDTVALGAGPQVRDFVARWVNATLLYEEAKREGLERDPEVNRTLEEMKRRLAIDRLLEKKVYTDELREIGDEEIKTYYEKHKGDYLLTENVAKIQYVLFSNREAATSFRNQVVKSQKWFEVLADFVQNSSLASSIISRVDSLYIKGSTAAAKELWKTAAQLSAGEISPVTKAEEGYYVLRSLGVQQKGDIAELSFVEPEIRDRVLVEKHQKALERFLDRLRKKYAVELNLDVLGTADTTQTQR